MISAVILDLRDTLLKVDKSYKKSGDFLFKFLKQKSPTLTKKEFNNRLKESLTFISKKFGKDPTIHNRELLIVSHLLNSLNITLTNPQLNKLLNQYSNTFVENASLYPDAKFLLNFLKKNKIKTGLVIDGTIKRETKIMQKTGLNKLITAITISEAIGKNKFTPEPLKDVLKKLNATPKSTLVIGDRIDKDIVHANQLGCLSVKLERKKGRYTHQTALSNLEKPDYTIQTLKQLIKIIKTYVN